MARDIPIYPVDNQQLGPLVQQPAPGSSPNPDELLALIAAAHNNTQSAQAQMAQDLQSYQDANSAPTEQINPLAAALGSSLARIGTTLAGPNGPNYSAQQSALLESKNKGFETSRKENLVRLRATYEAAAKRAAEAGDHEAEIKARASIHKLDTQEKKDAAEAKQKFDEDQQKRLFGQQQKLQDERLTAEAKRAQEALDAKKGTTAQDFQDVVDNNTRTVTFKDGTSVDYIDATNIKGKDLTAAQQIAAKTGKPLLAGKQVDSVHEVENASSTVKSYMDAIRPYLAKNAMDPKRLTTPLSAMLGIGDVGAVKAYNEAMIQIIPSLVTRGIRITQGEIAQLQKNTPKLSDPINIAVGKAEIYQSVLDKIARREVAVGKNRKTMFQQATPESGTPKANYKFNPATGQIEAL